MDQRRCILADTRSSRRLSRAAVCSLRGPSVRPHPQASRTSACSGLLRGSTVRGIRHDDGSAPPRGRTTEANMLANAGTCPSLSCSAAAMPLIAPKEAVYSGKYFRAPLGAAPWLKRATGCAFARRGLRQPPCWHRSKPPSSRISSDNEKCFQGWVVVSRPGRRIARRSDSLSL